MKRNENIRQAFIQSAIRVVARVGLDKTTTKAIAADAGLNEAYIYRCFEGKEDLLRAAFHMADVNFASIIRQNLFHMKNSDLPWKERAFRLWSACWRFVLESRDVCAFYLRYYYSANCRKYAYEEHLQYFQELIAMTASAFRPETNAYMVVHQMFDTMLSFAVSVLGGEIPDDDATAVLAFEQIYSFVVPHVREELLSEEDFRTA